jgi:hypothetical protein
MQTWIPHYANKRKGKTTATLLRDDLRRKNRKGDSSWRKRRREQAALEEKRAKAEERAKERREKMTALKEQIRLKRDAQLTAKAADKKRSLLKTKAKLAVANRSKRLERLIIESRKSAAFHRKRKLGAKRR